PPAPAPLHRPLRGPPPPPLDPTALEGCKCCDHRSDCPPAHVTVAVRDAARCSAGVKPNISTKTTSRNFTGTHFDGPPVQTIESHQAPKAAPERVNSETAVQLEFRNTRSKT